MFVSKIRIVLAQQGFWWYHFFCSKGWRPSAGRCLGASYTGNCLNFHSKYVLSPMMLPSQTDALSRAVPARELSCHVNKLFLSACLPFCFSIQSWSRAAPPCTASSPYNPGLQHCGQDKSLFFKNYLVPGICNNEKWPKVGTFSYFSKGPWRIRSWQGTRKQSYWSCVFSWLPDSF